MNTSQFLRYMRDMRDYGIEGQDKTAAWVATETATTWYKGSAAAAAQVCACIAAAHRISP